MASVNLSPPPFTFCLANPGDYFSRFQLEISNLPFKMQLRILFLEASREFP